MSCPGRDYICIIRVEGRDVHRGVFKAKRLSTPGGRSPASEVIETREPSLLSY